MPVSSSRRTRSATAAGLRLTRRPNSAKVRRAFSWRASRRPQSVASIVGVETAVIALYYARIDPTLAYLSLIATGLWSSERIFFRYGSDDIRAWGDPRRPGQSALWNGLAPGSRRRPHRPRGALATALEPSRVASGAALERQRSDGPALLVVQASGEQ